MCPRTSFCTRCKKNLALWLKFVYSWELEHICFWDGRPGSHLLSLWIKFVFLWSHTHIDNSAYFSDLTLDVN
jgi:hypothetical protein